MLPNDEKLCLYIKFKLFLHVTVKVNFYMNTDMDKTETYFLTDMNPFVLTASILGTSMYIY